MTDMAKVQDALNELRKEGKRAEALQTAIDTVGRYLEAQPKLTNLEDKSVAIEGWAGVAETLEILRTDRQRWLDEQAAVTA